MSRLLAIISALFGLTLVPLALVGPTAWLVVPAHALFAAQVTMITLLDGVAGRSERARVFGAVYLVLSMAVVGALEFGSALEGRRYWIVPWFAMLLWGWIPPVVAGLSAWAGDTVRGWRSDRAVRVRQRQGRAIPASEAG